MPSRFRSPTCLLSSPHRLGARPSLWVRVSPSVPSRPRALRFVSERAGINGVSQVLRRSFPCMPCPDDPGRPPESHQNDSFAWASRKRKRWPPASIIGISGLYQTSGRCGLPYGLHGSLCTLQTFRSVCRSTLLLRICNTRYGWLVRPYPAGTLTLQEAPSLSWRTRVGDERRNRAFCGFVRSIAGDSRHSHLPFYPDDDRREPAGLSFPGASMSNNSPDRLAARRLASWLRSITSASLAALTVP